MNRTARLLVLGVLVAFLSGTLAHAEPQGQRVQLKNGKVMMLKDGRAMTRGSGGPVPAPKGMYETTDGRTIVVGNNGRVEKIRPSGGGGKPKKQKPRGEEVVLKDGRRAFINDGRLYVVINQHGGQGKAPKGTYKTRDGRKIKVGGGGKIEWIKY